MRKTLVIIVTALAVIISGLAVAAPAQATKGDSRACVTAKEYRAVKKGQSKAQVKRILDGKGKKVNAKTRQYSECGSKSKVVRIKYKKPYAKKNNRVVRKQIITKTTAAPKPQQPTMAQRNAKGLAQDYLNVLAFSRDGLIGQLQYEGFSYADAAWGVDALDVDWNQQAVRLGRNYLDVLYFSRQGLIDQLEYEGFTYNQAVHAVNVIGL